VNQPLLTTQANTGPATWGTVPIGDSHVQVRHLILWIGIILWILPIFFFTEVTGIAWFSFNIAFLINLILVTTFVRSVSLHKLVLCFFTGGLLAGLVLAMEVALGSVFREPSLQRFLITVPLEELAKLLAVVIIVWRGRKFSAWTLGATDYLLMGAAVGAGFTIAEDSFMHAQNHMLNNLSLLMPASEFVNNRIVCGHAAWTALSAATLGVAALFKHEKRIALPCLLIGFVVATLDHMAQNVGMLFNGAFNTMVLNGYIALVLFAIALLSVILIDSSVSLKNLPAAKEFKFPRRKDRKEPLTALWDCIIDLRRLNYSYFRYKQYPEGEIPADLALTVAILAKRLVNRYLAAETSSTTSIKGSQSASANSGVSGENSAVAANAPAWVQTVNASLASHANASTVGSGAGPGIGSGVTPGPIPNTLAAARATNNRMPAYNANMEVSAGGLSPYDKRTLKDQIDLPERYKLQEEAFKGGMGIVFKAMHKQTRAALAIKVLHPHLADNTSYLMRFEQEAKAASQLKHPNIVTVHDFGITPNSIAYLVMEWLDGPSLEKVVKLSGPMSGQRFCQIFIQTSNALAHAHRKGVVHRDIKPSNIILTVSDVSADNVKLVDFGIAKIISDEVNLDLTSAGDLLGSPFFMSPEQCSGGKIDHRSDIYSLGCVMYEALCGKPPLMGSNAAQTYQKHLNEMPKQPRTINPSIVRPELYEPMLFKCLQKDPDKRFNSMEELEQELKIIQDALSRNI